MEFDKSRVYTALNADKLKVGSKIVAADSLGLLKKRVQSIGVDTKSDWPVELVKVDSEDDVYRFNVTQSDGDYAYELAYLVEEPQVLKWTDLKPGDTIREMDGDTCFFGPTIHRLVDMIDDDPDTIRHVHAGGRWIDNTELKGFIKEE